MGDLKRFAPGEGLKAWPDASWNQLVAGELRDRQRTIPAPPPGGVAAEIVGGVPVRVQNLSGAVVKAGGALVLGDALVDPADEPTTVHDGPAFEGSAPVGSTPSDARFCVLAETLGANDVGRGILLGATWARVAVSDAGHEYARLGTNADALVSATSGPARIQWKPSGTGTVDALVILGGQSAGGSAYLVVPAETIPAAVRFFSVVDGKPQWQLRLGSGLCYIYERDPSGPGNLAVPALDAAGNPRTLLVWNQCRESYAAAAVEAGGSGSGSGSGASATPDVVQLDDGTPVLFAVQDHRGDYYITRDCAAVGSMSSSSGSSSGSGSGSGSDSGGSDSGGSDSGGSGGSDSGGSDSGGGSGGGCDDPYTGSVQVLADVTWDPDTCEMTKTYKTLTFANGELCSVE